MKGQWSRVNLVKRDYRSAFRNERTLVTCNSCEARSASQRLTRHQCPFRLWSFHFPNANKKVYSPAMKHKKTVANIFQWKASVKWPKIDIVFFLLLWVLKYKDWSTLFFALGNERTLVTCVNLVKREVYFDQSCLFFVPESKVISPGNSKWYHFDGLRDITLELSDITKEF